MNTKWQFADYEMVSEPMRDAKSDSVVVGGQACNAAGLWAYRDCQDSRVTL